MRMIVGGRGENVSPADAPPISAVSSSLTILTTCWPGLSCLETSTPRHRSFTVAVNCLTTLKFTSASSSARRISRMAALMSASVSAPRWRTVESVPWSFSARESNIRDADSRGCSGIPPMPGDPSQGRLRGMTSPRLLRRALPAAACALAALPAAASADSIVFVKDANVWLAHADGSGAYQVTTDGTADAALPRARAVRRRHDRRLPPRRDRPHAPERRGDQHDRPRAARQQRRPRRRRPAREPRGLPRRLADRLLARRLRVPARRGLHDPRRHRLHRRRPPHPRRAVRRRCTAATRPSSPPPARSSSAATPARSTSPTSATTSRPTGSTTTTSFGQADATDLGDGELSRQGTASR